MSVKLRIALEELIASKIIDAILDGGFNVTVSDGEEETIKDSRSKAAILKSMFLSDEDTIYIRAEDKNIGWIEFYYGNSGYDVIHDYSTSLETFMKPIFEFINLIEEGGFKISITPFKKGHAWNNR